MYIGGEHILSPFKFFSSDKFDITKYINDKFDFKYKYYTPGGYHSVISIIENLNINRQNKILLPSYLCPSIINAFRTYNVKYEFYKIDKNLKIDFEDLLNRVDNDVKAVMIINYFGFPVLDFKGISRIKEIRGKGIRIIEDAVHSFYSMIQSVGDYVFNSFRKNLPVDCSILMSNVPMKLNSGKKWNKYLVKRNIGRMLRYFKLKYSVGWEKIYIKLIEESENDYTNKNMDVNPVSVKLLNKFNHNIIAEERNKNFKFLLANFKDIAVYKSIDNNIIPLGFPILIENRNKIKDKLINEKIFCPVHWLMNDYINKSEYEDSYFLSEKILTIPISFEHNNKKLNYLKNKLEQIL